MEKIHQSPPIVESIFRHLDARDLCKCALVCKLWSSMSAIEIKRRTKIQWFFQGIYCLNHEAIHATLFRPESEKYCFLEECYGFEGRLQEQLSNLRIKPAFCIAFSSYSLIEGFHEYFPSYEACEPRTKKQKRETQLHKRKYFKSVINTALSPYLPKQCKVTLAVAPGVIACRSDYSTVEQEDGTTLAGFCLPEMRGVEIHHFSVDGRKCNLSDLVPDQTKIKCLLAFLTPRGTSITNKLIQSCLLREESKVAVGGAIVDRTESLLGSVIAFCGDNIEASSLIIGPKDRKEDLPNKLKVFQETGLLKHRCFAFMFACVARGSSLYRTNGIESAAFRALYPKVPLIGVFGNGEIGVNYFPHIPTDNKVLKLGKFTASLKKYLHSYSTVFVLVSIKE